MLSSLFAFVARVVWVVGALTLAGCARTEGRPAEAPRLGATSALSEAPQAPDSGHLLITLQFRQNALSVLDARGVALPLPKPRAPAVHPWTLQVLDSDERVIYESSLPAANVLRSEGQTPTSALEGTEVRLQTFAFTVRVPHLRSADNLRVLTGNDVLGTVSYPHEATR